jgi:hypothetical protein
MSGIGAGAVLMEAFTKTSPPCLWRLAKVGKPRWPWANRLFRCLLRVRTSTAIHLAIGLRVSQVAKFS